MKLRYFLFALLWLEIITVSGFAQPSTEISPLLPNQPIERTLKGGEVHFYSISLTAAEYLQIVVDQRGIDVVLTLFSPEGRKLLEVDSPNGKRGPEPLSVIAQTTGKYQLSIHSLKKTAPNGNYEAKIEELRKATAQDANRVAAENIFRIIEQLTDEGTGKSFQTAITRGRVVLRLYQLAEDRDGQAKALNSIGLSYYSLGENDKAIEHYQRALQLYEATGNRIGQAKVLNNMGLASQLLGQTQKAFEYYDRALQLSRSANDLATEAITLGNVGLLYNALSDSQNALKYFTEALPIFDRVDDETGKATILANLGYIYDSTGEKKKALDYYEQVLPLFRNLGNKRAEGTILNNIGLVHYSLGETKKARDYYEMALPLRRLSGDRAGVAATLSNLGIVYNLLYEDDKALSSYKQALSAFRLIKDRNGEAATLNNIGLLYDSLNQMQKALYYYRQALPLFRLIGDRRGEGATLNNIGFIYYLLGQKQLALDYYGRSLLLRRITGDRNGEAGTLSNLMYAWRAVGNYRVAAIYGKQSINKYQELRYFIQELRKGSQRVFLKSIEDTYRFLAEILLAQKRTAEAIQILEILKKEEAFSYEVAGESQREKLNQTLELSPNESLYFNKLEKHLEEIAKPDSELSKLKQLKAQGIALTSEQQNKYVKLAAEVKKNEREFQPTLQRWADEFAKSPDDTKPSSTKLPIQNQLAQYGDDLAFIYTLVGRYAYHVILVGQDSIVSRSFAIPQGELYRKIYRFRNHLQNTDINPQGVGSELYKILIGPLEKQLDDLKVKTILWSLDRRLRLIPIAALWTGEKYFGQKYRNVNITVSNRSPLNNKVSEVWNILGVGTSETQNVKTPNEITKQYQGLTNVEKELKSIVKDTETDPTETGVLSGKRLLNSEFTVNALGRELAQKYKIVHIASHFSLNAGEMEQSYLVLGNGEILTVKDIKNNPAINFRNVELLTLSACETGVIGRDSDGIEVEGLGYIVQEKGAEAILSSLWKVQDESTSLFMTEFYRMKKDNPNLTKIEIIQNIQEKMINGEIKGSDSIKRGSSKKTDVTSKPILVPGFEKDKNRPFAHPYYWSPFVLIGNWK